MISLLQPPERSKHPNPIEGLRSTVSASRLNCFHQCRLKFYFRYVARLTKPTSPALFVGKAVHAVLQEWSTARWRGQSHPTEYFQAALKSAWAGAKEVAWDGEEEAQKQTAWSMLTTYFRETPIPAVEKPLGVEVSVEADLAEHGLPMLIGIIDLVRPNGRIVDFKTTGQTPNPERTAHQNELQLACYGLLYREATGEQETGFELHHLVKLRTPKVVVVPLGAMTTAQESRLFRSMESYLDGLDRRDFVPSPGMGCLSCEYFRECRAWSGDCAGSLERRAA